MKYEERNGLRILICDFGYLIHNKITDTYSEKVYLGKFASIDNYEEVVDENVNEKMFNKVRQIDSRINNLEQNTDLFDIFNKTINE